MAYVNLGQVIYPIGAIFASTSSTSPSSMFGGTWSQITGDACLMAGTTIGNIGSKTISEAQMPKHSHVISQGSAEKPTDTGHRNVGKAWYQTLGQGSYTTEDGDFLYTSAGVKTQWITPNAGTRLTGGGGNNICLTPTDAICGNALHSKEDQWYRVDALCVTSKISKSELARALRQFVHSQLEQYINLLIQQVQPVSMAEDGHLSPMVGSLDRKGLGIILAERMSTYSLLRKCQVINICQPMQEELAILVAERDIRLLLLIAMAVMQHTLLGQAVVPHTTIFPHIELAIAGIGLPNILGGVLC